VKYPELAVGAVIFNPKNKVLLLKSHKWNNEYVIPGGHVEWGEVMEEALRREILEETGLEIYDLELVGLKENIYSAGFQEQKHFVFVDFACRTDSSQVILNEEAEEYIWISLTEIDHYELNKLTRALLKELMNKAASPKKVEIIYDYGE